MACRSASVERAQKKSAKALAVIKKLDEDMNKLTDIEEKKFEEQINDYSNKIGIDDFVFGDSQNAVKVDFTHEFNVDALVPVIEGLLNTAAIALGASAGAAAIFAKPENIKVFADLLNGITQALKTTSTTGSSFSFNVNNIGPGFRAFTSIKSRTIQDKDTFGEESITAQTILYRLASSKKLTSKDTELTVLLSLNATVKYLADARVGLATKVKNGELSIAEFMKLSRDYSASIRYHEEEIAKRVDARTLEKVTLKSFAAMPEKHEPIKGIYTNTQAIALLNEAIQFFQTKSNIYLPALNESKQLLFDYNQGTF